MEDTQETAEQLFVAVLGLDPSERSAYLSKVCHDCPDLRERVEQMLKEDDFSGSCLKQPLFGCPPFHGSPDVLSTAPSTDDPPHKNPSSNSYRSQFNRGEVLLDRFVVIRFIARGGMGEVYEVEDRHLRSVHVALKTILSHYAGDRSMQERFEREVLSAREVVHPNLCPIYDIFHWKRPEGQLAFLTMKLLAGETLAARLARTGPLPTPEASLTIKQVGLGLSAAHDAGILHRDIKASNIILDGFGEKVCACVTDFGLARAAQSETTALTAGGIVGTPGYMAPELFDGGSPSKASDVFSFGVVAYQALTGHLPRISLNSAADKSIEALTKDFPPPWKQVLCGCLDPSLDRRYKDMPSVLRSLTEPAIESTDSLHSTPFLSRRRMIALAATGCLAVTGWAWLERDRLKKWLEPLPSKRFVALIAWPAGESQSVVLTILDSIRNVLAREERYVKDLLIIGFNDIPGTATGPKSPTASVAALGANLVLAVSLRSDTSLLTLTLQVIDAITQRNLRSIEIKCTRDRLSSMVEDASNAALALLDLPPGELYLNDQQELKRVSPETFRDFSEAQELANEPNDLGLTGAILKYQRALIDDPYFALGYARLAIAYVRLYCVKGDSANLGLGERNASLSLRLNPNSASGLFSEGLCLLYLGKPDAAIDLFARSLRIDPGNPEILLNKAWAFRNLGQFREAELAFRDIIKERPNYWPAYDGLGWVLWRQAKYKEAANAYDAAANAAPNVALPLANLGALYQELGKRDEAIAALNSSLRRSINEEALLALGDIAFSDKKYTAALDYYQRAAGQNPTYHVTWRNIADCYAVLGKPELVQKNYAKAAEIMSDLLAMNPGDGAGWATLAFYHAKIHDEPRAEADIARAQNASDVESQFMLVQAMAVLGKKEEALQLLLKCMGRGLAPIEVNGALDLEGLRNDPRYLSLVMKLRTKDGFKP